MAGTPPEAARTSINASAAKVALELLARPVCAMNLIGGLGWFTGWENGRRLPCQVQVHLFRPAQRQWISWWSPAGPRAVPGGEASWGPPGAKREAHFAELRNPVRDIAHQATGPRAADMDLDTAGRLVDSNG